MLGVSHDLIIEADCISADNPRQRQGAVEARLDDDAVTFATEGRGDAVGVEFAHDGTPIPSA